MENVINCHFVVFFPNLKRKLGQMSLRTQCFQCISLAAVVSLNINPFVFTFSTIDYHATCSRQGHVVHIARTCTLKRSESLFLMHVVKTIRNRCHDRHLIRMQNIFSAKYTHYSSIYKFRSFQTTYDCSYSNECM